MIRCDDVSDWILNVGQWELTDQERDEVLHNTHELWKEHPKSDEEKKAVLDSQKWAKTEHSQNSAVFFSGTHRWHYRDKIPAGTADVIMFHYNPV
jgi:hypothetical protein